MRIVLAVIFLFMVFISAKKNNEPRLPKFISKQFSWVDSGEIEIENAKYNVASFYIQTYEVTNAEYRKFLQYLKQNNRPGEYKNALPDTVNWLQISKPFVDYYFSHPAYNNYPAVNINHASAKLYCNWLTQQINAANKDKNIEFEARLPNRNEWIKAALGKRKIAVYSWGGPYLRNSEGKNLCNYKSLGSENIHYDSVKGYEIVFLDRQDADYILAPVKSYWPNSIGLFNMNGNASEMIDQDGIAVGGGWNSTGYDVRNESTMKYDRSSIYVGFRPIIEVKQRK